MPTVKRAYGDWTTQQLVGWKDELNQHAIQPMQQFAYTTGKNSTDSALIIDAMDLLYAGNLDAFAIVSSDSDFTRLATRLRESGQTVYGLGRRRDARLAGRRLRPVHLPRGCSSAGARRRRRRRPTRRRRRPDGRGRPDAARRPHRLPTLRRPAHRAVDADLARRRLGLALGRSAATSAAATPPSTRATTATPSWSTLARAQNYLDVEQAAGEPVRVRLRSSAAGQEVGTPQTPAAKKAAQG